MKKLLLLTVLGLLHFSCGVFATALPENHSVNGGLTIIPMESKSRPEAFYQGKRVPVLPGMQRHQWLIIVGIPLSVKEPLQYIKIRNGRKSELPFYVTDKFYTTQHLSIKDVRKVEPNAQDLIRIKKETKKLNKIFANYSTTNPFEQTFAAPLRGPISSLFGLQRVYNKQPRDPHSGLDIAAKTGEPIYAANKGIVVETGDYFYTGNTVIINHGMGVFSLYAHLNKILVKNGERIKRGQKLGLVGMTGRVTGPHLHWTMIVNQTQVEPLLFVPVRNIALSVAPVAKKNNESKLNSKSKSDKEHHD